MSAARGGGGSGDGCGARQVGDGRHPAQRRALRAQQMAERLGARVGDEQRGAGIGDDAGNAAQVLLDLRRARRRVKRHRHAAGVERTIEGGKKFAAGGEHNGDAVAMNRGRRDAVASNRVRRDAVARVRFGRDAFAGVEAEVEQPRRQRPRLGPQRAVADVLAVPAPRPPA